MIEKLDSIIAILRKRFPYYTYLNAAREEIEDLSLNDNNFAIIVKNIPSYEIELFHEFANKILLPIAETDENLPLIITLQIKDQITLWKYANNHLNSNNKNSIPSSGAAEDYVFKIAA